MSRERELVKRATEALKYWMDATSHSVDWELLEDLESYLSTPEPEQDDEPVAYRHLHEDGWEYYDAPTGDDCNGCHALYLHPAPRPEFVRLSEEEVNEILSLAHTPYEAICVTENMLVRKNTINKSDPDSIDLQSRCRGDKL